ncbi:MAG TPA: hypothetical protein VF618_19240 [Thermoanaerobaculia bacterium]
MIRAPLSTTAVLDESTELVSLTAAPWIGLLVLTSLPWRFMQVLFFDRLFEAGDEASRYGNLLHGTANFTIAALLVAFWGRAVYARACRLAASRGTSPGREALRVPASALGSYFFTGSLAELIKWSTLFTCLGLPLGLAFGGLALGTMELNERPGVLRPLGYIRKYAGRTAIVVSLLMVFFVAFLVALINVSMAFGLGLWLVSALGGVALPEWQVLLSGSNRRFVLLWIAGALLVVEPFWIAANVMLVRKAGAEESGDDLRAWFHEVGGDA